MKLRIWLWMMVISLLVGGCAAPSADMQSTLALSPTPAVIQVMPSVTLTQTATLAPSFTPVPAIPTATLTPTPRTPVVQKCAAMLPALPEDQTYAGKLILEGAWISPKNSLLLDDESYFEASSYDLTTRQTHFLAPPYKLQNIALSPDQTKYAVQEPNGRQIQVFSAQGQLLATVPLEKNTWLLSDWINNQQLAISITDPVLFPDGHAYMPEFITNAMIANPFTHEQKRITSNYPDMSTPTNILSWSMASTMIYDPMLTRVIYPADTGYTLWDVVNQKKLATIFPRFPTSAPKWTVDRSKFAVMGMLSGNIYSENWDFLSVNRDGEVHRMTYLARQKGEGLNRLALTNSAYSWSPDGRYFAFWLDAIVSDTATLATLDTLTGIVTDHCIATRNAGDIITIDHTPIWSPDGKALATIANMQEQDDRTTYDTVLIDLEHNVATKIGENLTPVGWLDTRPPDP